MTQIPVVETALTGIRFVRARPRVAAIWGAVQIVLGLGMTVVMVSVLGPLMGQAMAVGLTGQRDPALAQAYFGRVLPLYAALAPLFVIYYAVLLGAVNRAVLNPEDDRFAYLRLGADELRLALLLLATVVVLFVAELIVAIPLVLLGVILAVTLRGAANAILQLIPLLVLAGVAYVMARLSLASPMTFAERRVRLLASWKLTKGHVWPLIGVYALSLGLMVVVSLLVLAISLGAAAALGGGTDITAFMFRPDTSSLGAYLTPARIVFLAINAASAGLVQPLILMPAAQAYRDLRAAEPL